MKRKLLLAAVMASFLALASLLNAPANAQIGLGKSPLEGTSTADVTIGSGFQLFLDDGTVGAPALAFTSDVDLGLYYIGEANIGFSVAGALVFDLEDTNAAGAGADLATITATTGIMDGSDTVNGLRISVTSNNHTGSSNVLAGIQIDSVTDDAQSSEYGIRVGSGFSQGTLIVEGSSMVFETEAVNGNYNFLGGNGVSNLVLYDSINVSGGRPSFLKIVPTSEGGGLGSQSASWFLIDGTNPTHSGQNNTLHGINLSSITGDSEANEVGLAIYDGWDMGIASVGLIYDRQNFEEPVREYQDDFTAKSLVDGEVQIAWGHDGVLFEYRNEQTVSTSHVIFTSTGGLSLAGDAGATGNEGVEINLGSSQNTTTGYLVAQTDQLCFAANITITLIGGTDQVVVGWRGNQAYDAGNVYTNYADYAVLAVNNIDGSIFALQDSTTGAAQSDDTTTNWANAETKTLKVCIDGTAETDYLLDGSLVTEVNTSDQIDAGIIMNPFISFLDVQSTAAGVIINWWEITAN